jgi:CxxC motif-containing protein (DUF1111 family)
MGNSFFKKPWVAAPSSTEARDGLGPVYNSTNCSGCHTDDGRGIGYSKKNGVDVVHLTMLFRLSEKQPDGSVKDHPVYGGQLNPIGIGGVKGEGKPDVTFKEVAGTFADGTSYTLREPRFTFAHLNYGPFDDNTLYSPRVAPQMIGLGLVDALPAEALLANADENDANQDGISGRANIVFDIRTQSFRLGRFGWKAGQPSLEQQSAGAFAGDMGITSFLFPAENCTLVQIDCLNAPSGGNATGEFEADPVLHQVVVYTQTLGVPARRNADNPDVIAGEKLFKQIGCAGCHTPSFQTDDASPIAALRGQTFYPYSDFLLHDMGPELADHRPEALATGTEWRTPPLWGVGLLQKVNKHQNLLHDARARGVEEAILWHGGEGAAAREAYKNLAKTNRDRVVSFINSL